MSTRWDPFRSINKELSSLHREVDDLFRKTFGFGTESKGNGMSPTVNTYLKENTFCIEAELPGVSKRDLEVSVDGDMLTLRGERKENKEIREEEYILRESQFGTFLRRLPLPEGADTEQIDASFERGVLKISMPLEKKTTRGRKVEIKDSEDETKVH